MGKNFDDILTQAP